MWLSHWASHQTTWQKFQVKASQFIPSMSTSILQKNKLNKKVRMFCFNCSLRYYKCKFLTLVGESLLWCSKKEKNIKGSKAALEKSRGKKLKSSSEERWPAESRGSSRSLKVGCGIWHRDVSSTCFKFLTWCAGDSTDTWSDWDRDNTEAKSTPPTHRWAADVLTKPSSEHHLALSKLTRWTWRPNGPLLPHPCTGIMMKSMSVTSVSGQRSACSPELPEKPPSSVFNASALSGSKPQGWREGIYPPQPPPTLIKHRKASGVPLSQATGTLLVLFLLFYFLCYIVTH